MRLICHKCTNYFLLRNFFFTFFTLSIAYPSSHIQLRQLADFPSSHTQLHQLADFPSLKVRSSFAQGSVGEF